MVADVEELKEMDASELHARMLNAKKVSTPMKGDNFIFPVADGTVKVFGGDQRLRTSTLIRDRPDWGEEQGNLQRGLDALSSPTPRQDDSTRDDAEAKMTSRLLREISFIAITWNLESKNCMCRENNHFQIHSSTSTLPEIHIHRWM